ncbi:FMRFamide receptor [Toxocara canis]|uniref:FMRFamide receptor n=2 Tax=Toxocara canis TaxID=6265 RepID=A0A0B2UWZ9_TOXCA|nr:FMRFamide receptor [Toxocara canis]VDM28534.1 unnamed protein product [Toxocara canis]
MVAPAPLMRSHTFVIVYRIVLFIFVMFLLPFVTLTVVNYKIIIALKLSSRLRFRMTSRCEEYEVPPELAKTGNNSHSVGHFNTERIVHQKAAMKEASKRREEGITVMLVAIVTEFLLFNFLAFANNVLELVFESFAASRYFQLLVEVSTLLVNLNGATTIVIYLVFGSKYRAVFKKIASKAFICLTNHQKPAYNSTLNGHPNEVTVLIMSNGDGAIKRRSFTALSSTVSLVHENVVTQNGTFVLVNHRPLEI